MAAAPRDRTVAMVLLAKSLRTFGYGFLTVLLPVHLSALGLGPRGIGLAITLILCSSAAMTLALRRPVERLGGRRILVGLAGLNVLSALVLIAARTPAPVVLAAMLGNLAVNVGESGPFLAIEQVLVTRARAGPELTMRMSLYYLVGYGAAGLGSLTVTPFGHARGPAGAGGAPPYQALFWLFAACGLAQMWIYARLPASARGPAPAAGHARPSRTLVYRLAALFALDALAGGFVVQSLIAYWFFVHFGLALASLGAVFFGIQILTAASLLVAVRASRSLGLVNTMVFSHLASNVLLLALALAPTPAWAVGLLLARALLSQMDVPTRQAFLMSVVRDDERDAAATITNASRTVAQSLSPALTGYVMQAVGLAAPFLLGGSLKIVYDVLLYATCRRALTTPGPPGPAGRAP